jgi:hypothetical protein
VVPCSAQCTCAVAIFPGVDHQRQERRFYAFDTEKIVVIAPTIKWSDNLPDPKQIDKAAGVAREPIGSAYDH